MVEKQLISRGIQNQAVLDAMRTIPREAFIPPDKQHLAYGDHPVPIGKMQTISQPYIVAFMTEAINPNPKQRVLEIGTGSGYQTAVLSKVVSTVYSIEIIEELGIRARNTLATLGHSNIHYKIGDGYSGWPEEGPFDAIMLTAAPPVLPNPLLEQLRVGGVLIAPVGTEVQHLIKITRNHDGFVHQKVMGVRFVPMTGEAQRQK